MENNLLLDKAEDFAVRIVNLWKYLLTKKEHEISEQIKRSGTSVGANISEAIYGASKKDFLNKLHISYKELNESKFWLRILHRTGYINDKEYNSIYSNAIELDKLLTSSIKTTKNNLNKENNKLPDEEE